MFLLHKSILNGNNVENCQINFLYVVEIIIMGTLTMFVICWIFYGLLCYKLWLLVSNKLSKLLLHFYHDFTKYQAPLSIYSIVNYESWQIPINFFFIELYKRIFYRIKKLESTKLLQKDNYNFDLYTMIFSTVCE